MLILFFYTYFLNFQNGHFRNDYFGNGRFFEMANFFRNGRQSFQLFNYHQMFYFNYNFSKTQSMQKNFDMKFLDNYILKRDNLKIIKIYKNKGG